MDDLEPQEYHTRRAQRMPSSDEVCSALDCI